MKLLFFPWVCSVWLALFAAPTWADIRGTPHNLSGKALRAEAAEVCVFCHTPGLGTQSAAPQTSDQKPAAWQKAVNQALVFTVYDDLGQLDANALTVGSQSVACLSCHDGQQAQIIVMSHSDHPFGVPYRGAAGFPFVAGKHLVAEDDFRDLSQGMIDNRPVFWVSRNGMTRRRTRADLPVYVRQNGASDGSIPYIECSSCHDPHSDKELFLRTSNVGSQLCLTCHIK